VDPEVEELLQFDVTLHVERVDDRLVLNLLALEEPRVVEIEAVSDLLDDIFLGIPLAVGEVHRLLLQWVKAQLLRELAELRGLKQREEHIQSGIDDRCKLSEL